MPDGEPPFLDEGGGNSRLEHRPVSKRSTAGDVTHLRRKSSGAMGRRKHARQLPQPGAVDEHAAEVEQQHFGNRHAGLSTPNSVPIQAIGAFTEQPGRNELWHFEHMSTS